MCFFLANSTPVVRNRLGMFVRFDSHLNHLSSETINSLFKYIYIYYSIYIKARGFDRVKHWANCSCMLCVVSICLGGVRG